MYATATARPAYNVNAKYLSQYMRHQKRATPVGPLIDLTVGLPNPDGIPQLAFLTSGRQTVDQNNPLQCKMTTLFT